MPRFNCKHCQKSYPVEESLNFRFHARGLCIGVEHKCKKNCQHAVRKAVKDLDGHPA